MLKNLFIIACCIGTIQVFAQKTLPDLKLKSLTGKQIDIKEVSQDKLVIFSFWATWCIPCINELDAINENYVDWQEESYFTIIAVSIDNTRTSSKVRPMVYGKDWNFQVLLDTNQDFKRAMNIASIPYLVVVKNNKILYSHSGYTPGYETELFNKIKELNIQ